MRHPATRLLPISLPLPEPSAIRPHGRYAASVSKSVAWARVATVLALLAPLATAGDAEEVRAPWGVRLRWAGTSATAPLGIDRRMISWQMTLSEAELLLGEKAYADRSGEGLWIVGGEEDGNWYADFGGFSPRDYPTVLYFADGKFYRYTVDIPPARFDVVERSLRQSSGEPSSASSGSVKNAMGAQFDQETRTWGLGDVEIYLAKRGGRVDAGTLMVTYLPLAETVPQETATAPF